MGDLYGHMGYLGVEVFDAPSVSALNWLLDMFLSRWDMFVLPLIGLSTGVVLMLYLFRRLKEF